MSDRFMLKKVVLLGLICSLAACSNTAGPPPGQVLIEDEPDYSEVPQTRTPVESPRREEPPSISAAYAPLLLKAEEAAARGDYERALALLERAQRIDPVSADIYLSMAKTHSARGDDIQSQATAQRGLLYCNSTLQCESLRRYAN